MSDLGGGRSYVLEWPELARWDLKSARAAAFRATHPSFRPFGDFIEDATEPVYPSREPSHMWPVFGVSSRNGVALSHMQIGATFNSSYKRIKKDWFLHNPTRANVGSLGRVPEVPCDAITSPEYQVWRIKRGLSPDFVEILLRQPFFLDLIECHRVGAVKERLFFENLCEIPIPFLGRARQREVIERWQEAQEQIVAARNRIEQRKIEMDLQFLAALGMRNSKQPQQDRAFAVQWRDVDRWGVRMIALNVLGQARSAFPEVPLSALCRIGSGGTPSRSQPSFFGGQIPWVKTTEVRNDIINSTEETLTEEGLQNSSARLYPAGSLIVAMYGQGATRGRTAKLGVEAATNQACAVLYDIDRQVETDFLWYFLMSQYDSMRSLASGNSQPNLNAALIGSLRIPVPPLAEQRKIVGAFEEGRLAISLEREAAERLVDEVDDEVGKLISGVAMIESQH